MVLSDATSFFIHKNSLVKLLKLNNYTQLDEALACIFFIFYVWKCFLEPKANSPKSYQLAIIDNYLFLCLSIELGHNMRSLEIKS